MKKVFSYLIVLVVGLFAFATATSAQEKYRAITKIGNVDISKGQKVIYVGRSGCGYCQAFVPGLNYLSEKYGFTYDYVNTDEISEEELDIWLEKLNIDYSEFGTPSFGVFSNGVLQESNVGFLPEEELFTFLQRNKIISSEATYETKYKNIKYITDQEYLDIIASNKKSLVLLSQITCSKCINSKEYLDELSQELNVDINYYDLGFNSQEDYDKFYNSNSYVTTELDKQTLGTPTFMIVIGTEVRAVLTEFEGKEDIEKFIKDYLIGDKVQDQFKTPVDYKKIAIIVLSVLLTISIVFNAISLVQLNKLKKK